MEEPNYDERTAKIFKELYTKHPLLQFLFPKRPKLDKDYIKKVIRQFYIVSAFNGIMFVITIIATIYSLFTFEDDPEKTFIENLGYTYYYILIIGYSLSVLVGMMLILNASWIYFKLN